MTNNRYAARARSLVGTRFRPQGRSAHGLDCVGVILRTFDLPDDAVRSDYRLRGDHLLDLKAELNRFFRRVPANRQQPGDVLLLKVAGDQYHLAVRTVDGFVHADSGLRRVVETPGDPAWPIVSPYRRRVREGKH